MIALSARIPCSGEGEPIIGRITRNRQLPHVLREDHVLLLNEDEHADDTAGFEAVLTKGGSLGQTIALPADLSYLAEGDIIRLDRRAGHIRSLFRTASPNNGLLVTERCNSKCVMCSQPPRDVQDGHLVDELRKVIRLMPPDTASLGFTGGEITLLHDGFISLLEDTRSFLPNTRVDVLTNARLLAYLRYAEKIASVKHPDLILCVPLYSDIDSLHDFVVQAHGAYDQTLRGIMNLARVGVRIEIRVVLHRYTAPGLPKLAEFVAMNLPFVNHVALMGLEMTGFTKANLEALWIDPLNYQSELVEAIERLDAARIRTSIYNHQLCLLPESLRHFARRSISDWKNTYMPECDGCRLRAECGGFFASATLRYSDHIQAIV
jgi:His-Xaa-Ser system radical SAM maturase HxsC